MPQLLISDSKGRIYNLPHLEATGMKGGCFFRLSGRELIKLPSGSELFRFPSRRPVGYSQKSGAFVVLEKDPWARKAKECFAVAAFISPGFTVSHNSSYRETNHPRILPLFSYAAVAFYKGEFYVAAVRVDQERRQDLRLMNIDLVKKNAAQLGKLFPRNRLIRHLKNCALVYGCPAAKNLFLSRYEAPLPTSPFCNARCIGCISFQPKERCSLTQPRIKFVPFAEEVAEIALFHLSRVKDPVVSFGQGCEGEPLLAADVLEKSIKLIRKKTAKGIINVNTNASRPKALARLIDAGLDSIRVSLNSARPKYYTKYYRPQKYTFKDVLESIRFAKKKGTFVCINYLTMPGFTDTQDEFAALKNLIENLRIDMIQWRNLNYDPLWYFRDLGVAVNGLKMLGIRTVIDSLRKSFPKVMTGYFNPSQMRIRRHR